VSIKVYEAYRVKRGVDPFELLWDLKRRGQEEVKKRLRVLFEDILDGRAQKAADRLSERNRAFHEWLQANHKPSEEIEATDLIRLYDTWFKDICPPDLKEKPQGDIAVTHEKILTDIDRKKDEDDAAKAGIFDIDLWMMKQYGEQLSSFQRNMWALDVCITMRRYRSRFYLIPYCDRASVVGGSLDFLEKDDRLEDFAYWNNADAPDDVSEAQWRWRSTVWNDLTEDDRWKEYVVIDILNWGGWSDVSPMLELMHERSGEA